MTTTLTLPLSPETTATASSAPGLFRAWTSSFLIYFYPRSISRRWLAISPRKAAIIAAINLALAVPWLLLVLVSIDAFSNALLRVSHNYTQDYLPNPVHEFLQLFATLPAHAAALLSPLDILQRTSFAITAFFILVAAFVIPYFLILPFAARPGPNKPAVKHTLRTVLLATGFINVWAPIIAAVFILFIVYREQPHFDIILGWITLLLTALTFWTFASLLVAARQDYRSPAELPQPKDPTCDTCGYDLIAADPQGRCPECGTPVLQSVGLHIRPPTPWESHPSPLNLRAVKNQFARLLTQPRKLFLSMPTLSGQPAAQRWLICSLIAVAIVASLLVPAINFVLFSNVGLSLNTLWGAIIIGIAWAFMALMMVGIETAGIATFSRMKGHTVPLAAAAKVTAYSSPLMLFWVLLGAAQLLLTLHLWDQNFFTHRSIRTEQVYLALSLAIAHIGGLLWYELTVYRGIRSIQFANR